MKIHSVYDPEFKPCGQIIDGMDDVCAEIISVLKDAPCSAKLGDGFQVMVALPKNTNTEMPNITARSFEDKRLWARNKWLLAHKDTSEAAAGAYVGLVGENIDIAAYI